MSLVIYVNTNDGWSGHLIFNAKSMKDVGKKLRVVRDQFYKISEQKRSFKIYGVFRFKNRRFEFEGDKKHIKIKPLKQRRLTEWLS